MPYRALLFSSVSNYFRIIFKPNCVVFYYVACFSLAALSNEKIKPCCLSLRFSFSFRIIAPYTSSPHLSLVALLSERQWKIYRPIVPFLDATRDHQRLCRDGRVGCSVHQEENQRFSTGTRSIIRAWPTDGYSRLLLFDIFVQNETSPGII